MIGETLRIDLQEKFDNDWSSFDLFVDRLNTLGDQDAHDLAVLIAIFKEKRKIKEISKEPLTTNQMITFDSGLKEYLNKKEIKEYHNFVDKNKQFMSQHEDHYMWKMKKVLYKDKTYSHYGFILNGFEFNKKCIKLFTNENLENITNTNIDDLLQITSLRGSVYYKYFMSILNILIAPKTALREIQVGIRTCENIYIPCIQKIKSFIFKGKNYEELNIFMSYDIDKCHIDRLNEIRLRKEKEEEEKSNLKKAKIKAKYQKIKNVGSDAFKKLCVLYYASNDYNNEKKKRWK
jgi:hypothetical protein